MAQTCLPPGFRFHPTDVELVAYYLKRKLMGKKPLVQAISDVDMYKFAPWDLPAQSCLQSRDLEWFFFCPRDKKYPKGSRTNRSTPNGYWKTSGKDRTIELNSRIVGSKKTLIFHEGKAPKGNRTDWVMYEYKMEDNELVSAGFSKDDYVLCKIFKKSGLGPRIGEQYGAPFNEAEWELADAETSMFPLLQTTNVETSAFPLLPSSEVVNSTDETYVQPSVAVKAIEELPVQHLRDVYTGNKSTSLNTNAIDDCALMELPYQHSVQSIGDEVVSVNNFSNKINNADSPLVDGLVLEELSRFLTDSPHHGNPVGEHSGLPPMSEAEAHAFEVNTNDLYNEITGLAELGVPNGDGISVSNPGVTEQHTSQPTYIGVPSNENYLNMDDLFAPDPTLSYAYAVPNNPYWKFPMDQSAYDSTTSAAFLSSPTMPSFADDLPAIANNDVSDTGDIVGFHMLAVVHN
uniref:NAC domain-containing protein n=1 Tax=Leersia perrieri TaxID=77586 RepID=A0A0D9WGR4_9ORYZ